MIIDVPNELQAKRMSPGMDRGRGWNIEEHFHNWLRVNAVDPPMPYVPVYWWNNAMVGYCENPREGFRRVPAVEQFIETLPRDRCFTVSRGADGIYEDVPRKMLVFSSGGTGDFAIPLLCELEEGPTMDKTVLASFVGNLSPGGPEEPRPVRRSSSNLNGVGTRIRRKMAEAFEGQKDCVIREQHMMSWSSSERVRHQQFCDIAASSWFGLAPRGYGKTSYRLYEMMHLGTIPVYIYDEPWLPYLDQLDWRRIAVLCHESELPELPDRLRAISMGQRQAMLARAGELLEDYFTHDGVCRQIIQYMEQMG